MNHEKSKGRYYGSAEAGDKRVRRFYHGIDCSGMDGAGHLSAGPANLKGRI